MGKESKMIDKSNEVFDRTMTYVINSIPGLTEENFGSDETSAPPTFPFIQIVQTRDITYKDGQDDRPQENFAILLFQVEVFSNKAEGKRSECRKIISVVDGFMHRMNFSRESGAFVENQSNNSIARYVATYSVLANENYFYRR